MTRYQYVARLIPIRKQLEVVDPTKAGSSNVRRDLFRPRTQAPRPGRRPPRPRHHQGRRMARHAPRPPRLADRHVPPRSRQQRRRRRPRPHPSGTPVSVGFSPDVTAEFGESGIRRHLVAKLNEVASSGAASPPTEAHRSPTGWHSRNEPNTQAPRRATSSSTAATTPPTGRTGARRPVGPAQTMTGRSRRRRKPPGATSRGGWGNAHQRRRAAIAPIVNAGKATCARCNEPIHQGEEWHLDHNDTRDGYLGVAHAACNLREERTRPTASVARPLRPAALPLVTTLVRRPARRHDQLLRRTKPPDLPRQRRMAAAGMKGRTTRE